MKLLVLSDLHHELGSPPMALPDEALYDAVVLAGDIHAYDHGIAWAAETFTKPVIYVAGNHEFWGADLSMLSRLKETAAKTGNVHFLENTTLTLGNTRFIGATLFSNFELFGSSFTDVAYAMNEADKYVPDYREIRVDKVHAFRPTDAARLCRQSIGFIKDQLGIPFAGKTVVVTHYMPALASADERFQKSLICASAANDFTDVISKVNGLWIHGHGHSSADYEIDKCRVVSNPRGITRRSGELENTAFNPGFIVEVAS